MNVIFTDFCGFTPSDEWHQMERVLRSVPVCVKESDQAGKIGSLIFDPVGTNEAIKSALQALGWGTNIPIPRKHSVLGTDVDYGINGVLSEGQFSNYPFFLNNVFRINFFHKKRVVFQYIGHVEASIIITKVRAFPASNSTLYYEQALGQMNFMLGAEALNTPTRLVGLGADIGAPFDATFTTYAARRYSRTVVTQETIQCKLQAGRRKPAGRCRIVRL